MKLVVDWITGDELISDVYDLKNVDGSRPAVLDGAEADPVVTYKAKMVKKGNENIDVGGGDGTFANPDAEVDDGKADEVVEKIDLVDSFGLEQHPAISDKKSLSTIFKEYFKGLKEKFQEKYEGDLLETKMAMLKVHGAAIQEVLKDIVAGNNFDKYQFYTGQKQEFEGLFIPARYDGEDPAPTFFFFMIGTKLEKQ